MKVYRVGGSVRDELLGLPADAATDRDFVVVGATPDEMAARGFKPVGRDFPVFLHPETHEEYALARTERKSGSGHQGFVFHADPGVTLEEDLARRDLTINAMARTEDSGGAGALIDPHGGVRDLESRLLRHVSPAFAEDPLRVLRVARFAARFDFAIAPETEALMRDIVESGELAELSPERVWREVSLGLMARKPSRMLSALRRCGALAAIAPEIDALYAKPGTGPQPDLGVAVGVALDVGVRTADGAPSLEVQYGILGRPMSIAAAESLSVRIRASNACRDAAVSAARHADTVERADSLTAEEWLALLSGVDIQRRPERLDRLLGVCRAWAPGGTGSFERIEQAVRGAAAALATVDYASLARDTGEGGSGVADRARALRLGALQTWLERKPLGN